MEMDYSNVDEDMWEWRCDEYCLEDNTSLDISKCLLNGVDQNEEPSYVFNDETTPVKACGDLVYQVSSTENMKKECSQNSEGSLQVKRRRTLYFGSEEYAAAALTNEEISSSILRSQETQDSISDISQWVSGFAEDTSAPIEEVLDQSSEGWLANCFNDSEMQIIPESSNSSGGADVQINIEEICGTPPECEANVVHELPVHTHRNVVFKGRKSYVRAPTKLASSVVYPFAFIKPCGVHGDVTLKDINQRIRDPPSNSTQNKEDPSISYPTSAFSGKPVVGKTKIRTEGGRGSITIMRTKG